MTLIFDTSALSRLLANDERLIRAVSHQDYDRMVIPLATDAEMRFSFSHGSKPEQNLANYEEFKRQFAVELALPDQDTSVIYAEIASWARHHSIALSNNDTWIAAASVQLGASLLTLDEDFGSLPQVRVVQLLDV